MNETIKESKCCETSATEVTDKDSGATHYECSYCQRECDATEVCVLCDGTGEINVPAKQVAGEVVDGYVEVCPHIIANAGKENDESGSDQ